MQHVRAGGYIQGLDARPSRLQLLCKLLKLLHIDEEQVLWCYGFLATSFHAHARLTQHSASYLAGQIHMIPLTPGLRANVSSGLYRYLSSNAMVIRDSHSSGTACRVRLPLEGHSQQPGLSAAGCYRR